MKNSLSNRLLCAAVVASAAGCDLDQSFLFPNAIEGVPGVVDLGTLVPIDVLTRPQVEDAVIYGEIGPTGTSEIGGITFNFNGINGSVCIWIDPESIFWNQSISPTRPQPTWRQPDNVFDDGDLDLRAGNTAFYTGTPGERIDDFKVRYTDALGNPVNVSFNDCKTASITNDVDEGHAGRGSPEYCTLKNTIEGVNYTVVLDTFSLPLDDDRLGYGLIFAKGECTGGSSGLGGGTASLAGLYNAGSDDIAAECVITGESVQPGVEQGKRAAKAKLPSPTWIGTEKPSWGKYSEAEAAFCGRTLDTFCKDERQKHTDCSWESPPGEDGSRCYCGNPQNNPTGGGF